MRCCAWNVRSLLVIVSDTCAVYTRFNGDSDHAQPQKMTNFSTNNHAQTNFMRDLCVIYASLAMGLGLYIRKLREGCINLNTPYVKALSHLAALSLRLHGVVKIPSAPWDRRKKWYFSWRWRCHGVLKATLAFLRSSMRFYGASRSYRVPFGNCSHGVSTACIEFSRRAHCVCTALSRRFTAITSSCICWT